MNFLPINKFAEYLGRYFFHEQNNRKYPKLPLLKLHSVLEGYCYRAASEVRLFFCNKNVINVIALKLDYYQIWKHIKKGGCQ